MGQKKTPIRTKEKYNTRKAGTPCKRGKNIRCKLATLVLLLIILLLETGIAVMLSDIRAKKEFAQLSAMVQEYEEKIPAVTLPAAKKDVPDQTELRIAQTTEPVATEPVMLGKYASLYEQNPDFFGWLKIENTIIDYPVMYTPEEPEKYIHADFKNRYSYGGIPFLEDSCTPESDNLIIYGHNMANGTMFRELFKYEKKSYWEQHPTIRFDTLYEEQEYEVLAAFYDRVYYTTEHVFKFYKFIDAEDEADFAYAVDNFKAKALYDTGVEASYGDQLITLVTCAYHVDNGRFVVVARRISAAD